MPKTGASARRSAGDALRHRRTSRTRTSSARTTALIAYAIAIPVASVWCGEIASTLSGQGPSQTLLERSPSSKT